MTVRRTELTGDAETGTVSCAWSCRGADFASTAPRSHADVPSALPPPKLNPGASLLACAPATWTQRLTCGSCGTVLAPLCEMVRVGVGVAVGLGFLAAVAVGDCFLVPVCLRVGVAEEVVFVIV